LPEIGMLMRKSVARLTAIQSLTSNLSTAKTSAKAIDLMTVPYHNHVDDADIDFGDALTDMNSAAPIPGDGTASSPPPNTFFLSDGVGDRVNGSPGCPQPVAKEALRKRCARRNRHARRVTQS
jgi:hypothetical protein